MHSQEIIGYRIINVEDDTFIGSDGYTNFVTADEPLPIRIGDAYRRLGAFLDQHPHCAHDSFCVEPVYREFTPVEKATKELSGLLSSLCSRHGVVLGLSQEQVEARLAQELASLGIR